MRSKGINSVRKAVRRGYWVGIAGLIVNILFIVAIIWVELQLVGVGSGFELPQLSSFMRWIR